MFCALAESKLTAPCTLLIVVLLLMLWLELVLFLVHARVATVFSVELSVSVVLWVADAFLTELELLVLALVLVSDDCEALVEASVSVLDALCVALFAAPPLVALRSFAAAPLEAEVLPPLDELLVYEELLLLLELEVLVTIGSGENVDVAEFVVELDVDVSFPLNVWFDDELFTSESL